MSITATTYAAPTPKDNMGEPAPRVDGRLKVTGQASYASDFDVKNPGYAYLVTSAIAKGSITAIDDGEARAVDGVLLILTHEKRCRRCEADQVQQGRRPCFDVRPCRCPRPRSGTAGRSSPWWSPTVSRRRARLRTR